MVSFLVGGEQSLGDLEFEAVDKTLFPFSFLGKLFASSKSDTSQVRFVPERYCKA